MSPLRMPSDDGTWTVHMGRRPGRSGHSLPAPPRTPSQARAPITRWLHWPVQPDWSRARCRTLRAASGPLRALPCTPLLPLSLSLPLLGRNRGGSWGCPSPTVGVMPWRNAVTLTAHGGAGPSWRLSPHRLAPRGVVAIRAGLARSRPRVRGRGQADNTHTRTRPRRARPHAGRVARSLYTCTHTRRSRAAFAGSRALTPPPLRAHASCASSS